MTNVRNGMRLPPKEQLLHACIAKQRILISDFNRGIQQLHDNGATEHSDDQPGLAEEMMLRHKHLADQLMFAGEELKVLVSMLPRAGERYEDVRLGSLVATDKGLFYVSVSIERFEVQGLPFVGISPKSPLYEAMAGKKKGDSFAFGAAKYQILETY